MDLADLAAMGFEPVAGFEQREGRVGLAPLGGEDGLAAVGVVYLLVEDGAVVYVGETELELSARLSGYLSPGASQSTNLHVRAGIDEALAAGRTVEVHALDPAPVSWMGLEVELVPGIEAALIEAIGPAWNR